MRKTSHRNAHEGVSVTENQPGVQATSFYGTDAASAKWRSQQAHVDADIEGLARDPVAEKLVTEWREAGLSSAEQRVRLTAHYSSPENVTALAAE